MAKGYIDTLIKIADDSKDDILNKKIDYKETKEFHETVFKDHGLSIENWTLHAPMELIRQTEGEAAVERMWQQLRDTEGDGGDSILVSCELSRKMDDLASHSQDSSVRQEATDWLNRVPNYDSISGVWKGAIAVWQMLWGSHTPGTEVLQESLNEENHLFKIDNDNDGQYEKQWVLVDNNIYDLNNTQEAIEAEGYIYRLYQQAGIEVETYWDFSKTLTERLLNGGWGHTDPTDWFYNQFYQSDPIGAFYEAMTHGDDQAVSIAGATPVLLDANRQGLHVADLQTLDTNQDGRLTGNEFQGLQVWIDANENGIGEANEFQTLAQAGIAQIHSSDYAFITQGNSQFTTTPGVAPSKSNEHRTDGNDAFDINYYAKYDGWYFNLSLITNFLGGGGHDTMGGSDRHDRLWGGTGNDSIQGYLGDDQFYGGAGDDNTYIFNQGDGKDTIVEGEHNGIDILKLGGGIFAEDVLVQVTEEGNLLLKLGTHDEVTIQGDLESIVFADDVVWDIPDLQNQLQTDFAIQSAQLFLVSLRVG
jgi:hypothetical protein